MARRVNLYLSDELAAAVLAELPNVNFSSVLAAGLRSLLGCRHDELGCTTCGHVESRRTITDEALSRFYADAVWEIGPLVYAGDGTAEGAARVLKRVAGGHSISSAAAIPLPRPSRSVRERAKVRDFPDRPAPAAALEAPRERYRASAS